MTKDSKERYSKEGHLIPRYLNYIAADALRRVCNPISSVVGYIPFLVAVAPRTVTAANTVPFTAVQTLSPSQETSVDQEGGNFDLSNWVDRGMTIRGGDSVYECLANLTAALDLVGQLNNVEYNGAAGALSLLPTVGALLGAPTREMWIVYKLVPIAGVLCMFLSLGGSITPSNAGDYDPAEPFSYGGFMPTTRVSTSPKPKPSRPTIIRIPVDTEAQDGLTAQARRFAAEVQERAEDDGGGGIFLGITIAMVMQFLLIIAMLIPMWYAQRGSVITWWCRVSVRDLFSFSWANMGRIFRYGVGYISGTS
jgi:hypothetical protein